MNIGEYVTTIKPYAGGAVIGAVGLAIVAFSADWVVTKGTMQENVKNAKISTLAQVCERTAENNWKKQGRKLSELEGWDNDQRQELAKQFAPAVIESGEIREDIIDQCDDLLRPA
jgi:hypothetical protein